MRRVLRFASRLLAIGALLAVGAVAGTAAWVRYGPHTLTVRSGNFPEEVVYVKSADDIINAGMVFAPPATSASPVAVIWLHGWGVNFYSPTYVMIGRALAQRGLTTVSVNTRMHDIGTVMGHRSGKRLRGGGYWGVTSEVSLDLDAWIDFAAEQGFDRVVLVGHSAAWSSVAGYQVQRQNPRVAGVVSASGAVQVQRPERDPALMAEATRLVEAGAGDDLIRLPNKSFPSFISASTFVDIANAPPHILDFFGLEMPTPGIASLRRPLLVFFGTRGDVGGPTDLEIVRASAAKHAHGAVPVETVMIDKGDHMYTGEESQVADVISEWVKRNVITTGANPVRR